MSDSIVIPRFSRGPDSALRCDLAEDYHGRYRGLLRTLGSEISPFSFQGMFGPRIVLIPRADMVRPKIPLQSSRHGNTVKPKSRRSPANNLERGNSPDSWSDFDMHLGFSVKDKLAVCLRSWSHRHMSSDTTAVRETQPWSKNDYRNYPTYVASPVNSEWPNAE